jgi:hypothetical protein
MKGSQHNDSFLKLDKGEEEKLDEKKKNLQTKTNNAGGTLGGISSGENIVHLHLHFFNVSISELPSSLFQPLVFRKKPLTILGKKLHLRLKDVMILVFCLEHLQSLKRWLLLY